MFVIKETSGNLKVGTRKFIGNIVLIKGYRCTYLYGQYYKVNTNNVVNTNTRYDIASKRFVRA